MARTPIYLSPAVATRFTSAKMRRLIRERDDGCQYCGGRATVVEHVLAQDLGGPALPWNLVLACDSCNMRKGERVWLPTNLETLRMLSPSWAALLERCVGLDRAGIVLAFEAWKKVHGAAVRSASDERRRAAGRAGAAASKLARAKREGR